MKKQDLLDMINKRPLSTCSPFYSRPCSKNCDVCNMDKDLYKMVINNI
jgi:hypothetical protein